MIAAIQATIQAHEDIYLILGFIALLLIHFYHNDRARPLTMLLALVVALIPAVFVLEIFYPEEHIEFADLVALLLCYGMAVFIVLSDVLIWGLAAYLTRKWGSWWVKAMDYPYLTFGCGGILLSANKLDMVHGRFSKLDILGPVVVVTAVAIRFVKTRADIGGWNVLPADG